MKARWRRASMSAGAAVLTALVSVIPTDIVHTGLFVRAVPVRWWELPVAIATAVMVGVWVALGDRRRDERGGRSVVAGVVLSVFAIGCPTCNKVVVLLLGTAGALGVWAPWQPALGLVSLALLAVAVATRLRFRAQSCPVPPSRP